MGIFDREDALAVLGSSFCQHVFLQNESCQEVFLDQKLKTTRKVKQIKRSLFLNIENTIPTRKED